MGPEQTGWTARVSPSIFAVVGLKASSAPATSKNCNGPLEVRPSELSKEMHGAAFGVRVAEKRAG